MKTWFITGISRGLGLSLARAALAAGDKVIGTVRSGTPDLDAAADRLDVLTLDVTDRAALDAAVADVFARHGRIDVIVNNAGYGLMGALETTSDEALDHLFETDVFAPVRLIRAAIPHLRRQGSGHIINITSVAGRAANVGYSLYAGVKSALEGISHSLSLELAPFGIHVTAVAPGAFRTDFLNPHSLRKADAAGADYEAHVGRTLAVFDANDGRQAGDPDRAATAILDLVATDAPPLHLLLGTDALDRTRARLAETSEEIDRWEALTRSTDYAAQAVPA
jgi:NAD(P)-dependent dehydrogenase (short-subunit alcohol dehydrogenase family)